MVKTWKIGLLVLIAMHLLSALSRFGRAKQTRHSVQFDVSWPFQFIFFSEIALLIWAVIEVAFGKSALVWMIPFIGGTLVLIWKTRPSTLLVADNGLTESKLLGKSRTLKWDEIVAASYSPTLDAVTVYGADGSTFIHSRVHRDSERFRREIIAKSKVKQVTIERVDSTTSLRI